MLRASHRLETCVDGDIVRFGRALLQVSQGRQPCWKLSLRFNQTGMARLVQMTRRTGWYQRVLEVRQACDGDNLGLVERTRPDWPVMRVLRLLYEASLAYSELEEMARLPELAEGWRRVAAKRIEKRAAEDWRKTAYRRDGNLDAMPAQQLFDGAGCCQLHHLIHAEEYLKRLLNLTN